MQALKVLASAVLLTACSGCEGQIIGPPGGQPPTRASWLSYKYSASCQGCPELTDPVEENAYYCAIGVTGGSATSMNALDCTDPQLPKLTFTKWKNDNNLAGAPDARAIYGNALDLRIGRDMNCVKSANGNVACYVTNYGPPPFLGDPDNKENPDWIGANTDFPEFTQA